MNKVRVLSSADQLFRYIEGKKASGATDIMIVSGESPRFCIGGITQEDSGSRIGSRLRDNRNRYVVDALIEKAFGEDFVKHDDPGSAVRSFRVRHKNLGRLRASALRSYDRQFTALRVNFD